MALDKTALIADARAAAAAAQWPTVLRLTDTLLAEDKTHPVALRLKARALGAHERWDEAHMTWEMVARVSPDLVEAPLNIARIEKRRGEWPKALAACDRVLQLQPTHVEGLKIAATAVEKHAKAAPSQFVWRSLALADVSTFLGIVLELDSQGRLIDASNAIAAGCDVRPDDHSIKQERGRLAQLLAEKAQALEGGGDFVRAAEHLRTAANLDKANGEVFRSKLARMVKPLVLAGREQLQAKNIEAAKLSFSETLTYDPDNESAMIGLARVHEQLDEWPQAVDFWTRVSDRDATNQLAWLRIGVGCDKLGDAGQAQKAFEKVTDPQYAEQVARGLERLANSSYKIARKHYVAGDFEKAADALDVAAQRLGETEDVASLRVRVLRAIARMQRAAFAERDYVTAVRHGERLLGAESADPEPWIMQARALHALKRSTDALAVWSEASKRAPDRADVFLGIARATLDIGALAESRRAIDAALKLAPADPKCLDHSAKLVRAGA